MNYMIIRCTRTKSGDSWIVSREGVFAEGYPTSMSVGMAEDAADVALSYVHDMILSGRDSGNAKVLGVERISLPKRLTFLVIVGTSAMRARGGF